MAPREARKVALLWISDALNSAAKTFKLMLLCYMAFS